MGGAEAAEGSPAEAKYASSEEACKAAKKFAVSGDAQQVPRCPEPEVSSIDCIACILCLYSMLVCVCVCLCLCLCFPAEPQQVD